MIRVFFVKAFPSPSTLAACRATRRSFAELPFPGYRGSNLAMASASAGAAASASAAPQTLFAKTKMENKAKAKALAERERSKLRGVCLLSSSEEIHHASEQV